VNASLTIMKDIITATKQDQQQKTSQLIAFGAA
jgi:hypothetical protein